MHYRCFFFVSLLLGLGASPTPPWAQEVTFTHVTTDDGLPSNVIEVILQDHRGYLWIGTTDEGLVRYDGYEMKVYQHVEGDATSLSPGTVWVLHESANGTLWVGTLGGLSRFDAATETFKVYQHVEGDSTSLSDDRVRALDESDNGTLWVGTDGGLSRFDAATETFKVYQHVEGDATSLSRSRVWALQETDDGTLWVGTMNGGLNRFDAATETFKAYRHVEGDPTSLSHDNVWALHESHDGILWVGTYGGGLNRFDAATETFEAYQHVEGDATSLSHDQVFALHESHDGTLWVGTDVGLNRFDAATETFEVYRHVEGDATSLSNNRVIALDESDDGMLWVGTWIGGLNRFDAASGTFEVYRHVADDPSSLSHDVVRALHESADGTLWVGGGGGLNRFDVATETFEAYRHVPGDSTSLSHDDVFALHESADGTLWVGTREGLSRLNVASEKFKVYRHVPGDTTSLSNNLALALHESDDGTLWVRTGDGLNRFDAATETFKAYRHFEGDVTSLNNNQIGGLHQSDDGMLWVGTDVGLNRFDPASGTFEVYRHVVGDSTSLSHNKIRSIHESNDGKLWIGTSDGLNRLEGDPADPASVSFSRFLTGTGSAIKSILEEEKGQLWLGLADGRLARFNPETGRARYFGKRHGLPAGGFYPGVLQSRNGTLYWGNGAGLISLRLERLPPVGEPPVVHLTELWLFDEHLAPGPDSPLKQALWQTESLQLTHRQNDLTFGFVGIHYADPEENRYQYRLLGYDRDWRSETKQRRATYTNLPPGNYTFEVKAANSDGIWTPEAVRLGVEILPPWWRTWWGYGLYGLLLVGLVFLADRVQRRRLIRKERAKAELREKDLRAQAAENLANYLQSENRRQTQELDAARDLQLSMLPQAIPEHPTVELAAFMQTATEVGGDYYDFDLSDDGTLTLAIGDATGHGTKAGTMVTATKSLWHAFSGEPDLAVVLAKSSRALKQMGLPKLYMALALARLRDYTLELAGAGMPPALVYRAATRQVEEIALKGVPLGGPAFSYQTTCVSLSPGDTVVFMSDGFPELFNEAREMLGYERAVSVFEEVASRSPEEIIAHLREVGETWANGRAQDDDVTFVVMKVKERTESA